MIEDLDSYYQRMVNNTNGLTSLKGRLAIKHYK